MVTSLRFPPAASELLDFADLIRVDAGRGLDPRRRADLGQFFTPAPIARLLASLSRVRADTLRFLDPGAGVGILTAAWVAEVCAGPDAPTRIEVTAYEVDAGLLPALGTTLDACERLCAETGISFSAVVNNEDFIQASVASLNGGFFAGSPNLFNCVLTNPPYKKIRTDSTERSQLRELGVEVTNLYTAFVSLALRSLQPRGEMIAITPRSFCNGPYFTSFRRDLLSLSALTDLHVFDSRDSAFQDDEVLQENLVYRAVRGISQPPSVTVAWSVSGASDDVVRREVAFGRVVHPRDSDAFIHITPDEWGSRVADIIQGLAGSLASLHLEVSTGRVVDFRVRDFLRSDPEPNSVPLIYPGHFAERGIAWPKPGSKKPNALAVADETTGQMNPIGNYVLVKRFSAKEEQRRVSAALFTPRTVTSDRVAFENHLNYFHRRGGGLPEELARGLVGYLNSTVVDGYFRQFNGHTQVNATDLRKLRYPTVEQLEVIGRRIIGSDITQEELDHIVEEELLALSPGGSASGAHSQRRISEALEILKSLGLPREQQNERSALTLLALLGLKPEDSWSAVSSPLCGVTPIMEFAAEHYGKQYAPNTRETVRRFTLHQFQDAGIVVANPDKPGRPVNSPAYCYQVPASVIELVRLYGSPGWNDALSRQLASAGTLAARYANEREMNRIPLRIREGIEVTLSPGGQNDLIEKIVSDFCPRFTPDGSLLYIGDADEKWAHFDAQALERLGVKVDSHGKMPDVVVYFAGKGWLVLIEAVTSHGPVNPKRHAELKKLFASSSAPLVFVTAFMTRQVLNKYLGDIAWETEVWVAEAPSHMIHFNGERFLGPYE